MKMVLGKLAGDVRGATAVEYGLIISLVVLASMGSLVAFASTSTGIWNNVSIQVRDAR